MCPQQCVFVYQDLNAKFRRRTSHEPNWMQTRKKILCSPSLAFASAHMKYCVWTGHKIIRAVASAMLWLRQSPWTTDDWGNAQGLIFFLGIYGVYDKYKRQKNENKITEASASVCLLLAGHGSDYEQIPCVKALNISRQKPCLKCSPHATGISCEISQMTLESNKLNFYVSFLRNWHFMGKIYYFINLSIDKFILPFSTRNILK